MNLWIIVWGFCLIGNDQYVTCNVAITDNNKYKSERECSRYAKSVRGERCIEASVMNKKGK